MHKKVKDIRCFNCHVVKSREKYFDGERRCSECVEKIYSRFDFETKVCPTCKSEKNIRFFNQSKSTKSGLYPSCTDCSKASKKKTRQTKPASQLVKKTYKQNYRAKHPERNDGYYRRANLAKYGLVTSDYDAIFANQNGVCAICKKAESAIDSSTKMVKMLAVDHNHDTGEVRGLLCSKCNTGLGLFNDSTANLISAINYLKETENA